MAHTVRRTYSEPYKLVVGGEEKYLYRCGLSKNQPFYDGSHKLANAARRSSATSRVSCRGHRHHAVPCDVPLRFKERRPHRLNLFYSNQRPDGAAFLPELQKLEQLNPNFHLIATTAEPEKSAQRWPGETGFIRRDMLERHPPDLKSPIYYFAGPPQMTMAMRQMLEGIGIVEEVMRYEEFYGY